MRSMPPTFTAIVDESGSSGIIVALLGLFLWNARLIDAADTLLSGQSLQDGQTLVSANRTFEFGFFGLDGSAFRYVGIWYHKSRVPAQTIVWVANRDRPIMDATSSITFDDYGNGMLVDSIGRIFVFTYGFGGNNGTAVTLLDSGNLVLRDAFDSSRVLWQSFDYPTDTILPGMKLGLEGRRNRFVISWISSSNPTPGYFCLGVNPNGTKQLFIWRMDTLYWDSGVWNGQRFNSLPDMPSEANFPVHFGYRPNESFVTLSRKNKSIITRFVMSNSGQLRQLIWVETSQEWLLFWAQPGPQCNVYNLCGVNGLCNEQSSQHCKCLVGFEPRSLADWRSGVTRDGCMRKTILQCADTHATHTTDGFVIVPRIFFPFDAQLLDVGSRQECQMLCSSNCSCTAYAFTDGCRLWYGDLKNLTEMDGEDHGNSGGDLYLRLAASELPAYASGGSHKRFPWAILTVTALFLVSLVCLPLVCFWWRRMKTDRARRRQEQSLLAWGAEIVGELAGKGDGVRDFTLFEFSRIADATNNFSPANKLGEGGFGPVYEGKLREGRKIAVKRLSPSSGQGLEEFKNEIILIAKLQHRNLVKLLGWCIKGEEKILVYEYMPNKSLDHFLFDPSRKAQLDWSRRLHIIEGVAQGLLYLHKHSRLRIIHRDLKASNILMDEELNPKISDFGLARTFASDETQANTKRIVGTFGYMSPEYALEGLVSIKSDVFSFGVLLLEIVSGRRNSGFHQYSSNSLNMLGYAWGLWNEGKWLELVDPVIKETCGAYQVRRCIHVALLCVQESADDRPTMSEVIAMLGGTEKSESAAPPPPKQPGFCTVRITKEAGNSSPIDKACTVNDATLTAIVAR